MINQISYGGQFIDNKDINLVSHALKRKIISSGKLVSKFENKISKFLKAKYIVSCNSGTSALYLSLKAAGVKKNDVVIMPMINFIASYNVCRMLEAKIYFSDVDKETGQMTPKFLTDCIKKNKIKKIKAVITMYMGGFPENISQFYYLKKKYAFSIIEDACHAFGASYKHNNKTFKVGSCKHSDVCTFSFHPLKPITTGEGGIVTTNNKNIYKDLLLLRSHGISRNKNKHWEYDVTKVGLNFRISDINCALGISQMNKLNKFLKKRRKIYQFYKKNLENYKNVINFPKYQRISSSSFHLVIINIKNFSNFKKSSLVKYLLKNNIITQYHYIPIENFSVYKKKKIHLPSSTQYYNTSVSIPIYHSLTLKHLKLVVKKIKQFFIKK